MNKWGWMMDWCKKNGFPPAQLWAWEMAKKAWEKHKKEQEKLKDK